MTPIFLTRSVFLSLASGAALAAAGSAPVALSPADISTYIQQISRTANGELCLVGEAMDPNGDLQSRGKVLLFSTASNKVLWQQTVDAPGDNAAVRMVACRSDGKFTYVGANVDTHSERSLSQSLAYVYKFDGRGKLVGKKELVTGATDAFVHDLDVGSGGVTVVGMTINAKTPAKANGMYFARLDGDLRTTSLTRLASGGYQHGAVARLSGNIALLGGDFLAADAGNGAGEDYAVSKIVAGKYQFSIRPQKGKPDQIATAITAADEIVSLGYLGNASVLTVVSPEGKIQSTPLRSALCQTVSMSADAGTVHAVRKSCAHPGQAAKLVAIDRKTGAETVKAGIAGEPVLVFSLDAKVYVVSKRDDGALLMQAIDKGQ